MNSEDVERREQIIIRITKKETDEWKEERKKKKEKKSNKFIYKVNE